MHRTRTLCCLLVLSLMLCGCGKAGEALKKPTPHPQLPKSDQPIQVDRDRSEKAEQAALAVPGVNDARAVAIDRDLTVGIQIRGFNRLHMQSIKQAVARRVHKTAPGQEVRVTSDKKLFSHLNTLRQDLQKPRPDLNQAKRELMRINEDM
ncbi:MAG: YhcN/YlaJ family sporulation lipoprotein [Solirubrobacterales bacterium]